MSESETASSTVADVPANKPALTPLKIETLEKAQNKNIRKLLSGKPVSTNAGHTPHPKKDSETEVVHGVSPMTDHAGHTPHVSRANSKRLLVKANDPQAS
eukprot:CAMPEP_0195518416 /NCGR_PEP_ID=MMETSP0794_2-20130614/12843_1 /TAXON_ID=515487 /ORGANISM="Stephanopyxis turris, Strain CCMP 815" /LENGTH=99 /DNA_ID=CAMNT_0040647371 /DNA_START=143 /DNA_END=442 /DNA_ORIENTATION=+